MVEVVGESELTVVVKMEVVVPGVDVCVNVSVAALVVAVVVVVVMAVVDELAFAEYADAVVVAGAMGLVESDVARALKVG